MNEGQFISALEAHGITLNEHQLKQFDQYFELLVETNKHLNLTTITERGDVYLKHFFDSITPAFFCASFTARCAYAVRCRCGGGVPVNSTEDCLSAT